MSSIKIFTPATGDYFRYCIRIEGRWLIYSGNFFHTPEQAFAAAVAQV